MPNNTKHTPEPWYAEKRTVRADLPVGGPDRAPFTHDVCKAIDQSDAARIVACVNALAGIANPKDAVEKAREALNLAQSIMDNPEDPGRDRRDIAELLRAALAALGGAK